MKTNDGLDCIARDNKLVKRIRNLGYAILFICVGCLVIEGQIIWLMTQHKPGASSTTGEPNSAGGSLRLAPAATEGITQTHVPPRVSKAVSARPPSGAPAALFTVTAYCAQSCCTYPFTDGYTASGVPAIGKIIAAPKRYPFGTVMIVPGYGRATVQDRGGSIKGNRIDLLFPTHEAALQWGRQELMVTIEKGI